jgi:hypothetical protein
MAGGIVRGDVRLYEFAPPEKKRPVLVLTRGSAVGYLSTVTVAPSGRSLGRPRSASCGTNHALDAPPRDLADHARYPVSRGAPLPLPTMKS